MPRNVGGMLGGRSARMLLLVASCGLAFVALASSSNVPREQPSVVAEHFIHAVRGNDADALARLLQPVHGGSSQAARAKTILAAVGDEVRASPPHAPFVGLGERLGDRSREAIVVQARAPHGDLTLWLRAYDTHYPIGVHVLPRRSWVIHAVYDGDTPVAGLPAFDPRAGI